MASWDHCRKLSRRLSRVMDDIGLNEEVVMSRRRGYLVVENIENLFVHLQQKNQTHYFFGSQSEGTTTEGLNSDVDKLIVKEDISLIQNLDTNDWAPDKINLLMIPDEAFPGYCKLQLLKRDRPNPEVVLPNDMFTFDEAGRVILNHVYTDGLGRHGPAEQVYLCKSSSVHELVRCIRCKTWPNGYKMWSTHPRKGTWPTQEMISYMENSGCFVVPVAHRLDEKKNESWRISTSLAERCLMFSLNITQIRCYTLIKMIVKTCIDPVIPDVISSYICKNLLFHCVENTRSDFWQETNLLRCVNQILLNMLVAVLCMNCPSYFNESINLFLGKVNTENRIVLLGLIWKVLISEGGFLAKIRYDNINESMHNYHETFYQRKDCSRAEKKSYHFRFTVAFLMYECLGVVIKIIMLKGELSQRDLMSLQSTLFLFALRGHFQYISATLLFPFLYSHFATLKASEHILHGDMLSHRTSMLYELSLDSDTTSSLLRYASYFYCTWQFVEAMSALSKVKSRCLDGCFVVCACDTRKTENIYYSVRLQSIQCLFPSRVVSMCVVFSQAERRCCPRELQYEMYRSTEQEKLQRHKDGYDDWMDLACIDSLSYLYFLWYMTNRHMGHRDLQLLALEQLNKCASENEHRHHGDTVYNLLGQCYEYENRFDEAFECYCKSLRVRPTNNAARWHIVLLLYRVYQNK